MSEPFMRPERLNQSWPKGRCWELLTQVYLVWMKLEIIPLDMTVTNVDVPVARETVQLMAKIARNVVVRTTLGKCVDLARDLTSLSQDMTQESRARPRVNAYINVNFMR